MAKPNQPPFHNEYSDEMYEDYFHYLDNCDGYGCKIQVTISVKDGKPRRATVTIIGDDMNGTDLFVDTTPVPLAWALAMTGREQ